MKILVILHVNLGVWHVYQPKNAEPANSMKISVKKTFPSEKALWRVERGVNSPPAYMIQGKWALMCSWMTWWLAAFMGRAYAYVYKNLETHLQLSFDIYI